MSALTDLLARLHACEDAIKWAETQPDLATAWAACERGDWMLWLAGRVGGRLEDVVLAACACARTALVHVPAGENRPRGAIETAERWARGEATIDAVAGTADDAARAAWAAAEDAWAAAGAAAGAAALAHSAELVRGIIPAAVIVAAAEAM